MNDINSPTETPNTEQPDVETEAAVMPVNDGDIEATMPRFAVMDESRQMADDTSLNRFLDINIKVSAELGSVTIPIGELLELGEGSVVKLERSVSSPVDVIANGIRVARGEVVVVDECFAIRIKEIDRAARKDC
jgi:flagellar motor switch protein FliN/FliY